MKLNSVIGLLTAFLACSCTIKQEVKETLDSISGIYPRLAYYNKEG